jgi:FkbM family methyltransferase
MKVFDPRILPMVSYAQNGEDVVLDRAFEGQAAGFYIDVGAWDPVVDSVTKHFYDKGWRGINIEPVAHYHERLAAERTGDINLKVAVGAGSTEERFVELEGSGLSGFASTLNRSAIDALGFLGFRFPERAIDIEVVSLAEIAGRYAQRQVDFLKIDVEGSERGVIASADWRAFRPRVVLVEAVAPLSGEPAWFAWESLLREAGYEFALFDGLNRFYYRAEEPELRQRLSVPANVLDKYVTVRFKALQDRAGELEARLAALATAGASP